MFPNSRTFFLTSTVTHPGSSSVFSVVSVSCFGASFFIILCFLDKKRVFLPLILDSVIVASAAAQLLLLFDELDCLIPFFWDSAMLEKLV